ncbi:MAG TPA: amidohydrolase family protein [Acidimicrobiales bacterium]|nr:amidohydrolase family protein [Acidimicrobiales bacterium]
MNVEDLVLVSVDDHVIEPPDVFARHVPERWQDQRPVQVEQPDGTIVWRYQGEEAATLALNAVVGRSPEELGYEPTSYDEIRKGCYDVTERVRDMDAGGVLGSLCFPSFPGFAGRLFATAPDKAISEVMVRAYNDWHVHEWCGAAPGRFIPLGIGPLWDPHVLAAEVRRLAELDCHAVTFSENPDRLGLPSLHSDTWDPFWAACSDVGTVPCIHIGSSSELTMTSMDAPVDVVTTLAPFAIMKCATDLVWSPIFRKFPDLRIALSEGGIGWVPYLLDRVDRTYKRHRYWTGQDFGDRLPSEVFREHVVTCFIQDPVGLANRHAIGVENITWECDYPHGDSIWPYSPEELLLEADGLSDEEIDLITHRNAMRIFRFDPFAVRPREACTVGALRAQAARSNVDTAEHRTGIRRGKPGQTMEQVIAQTNV